MTIENLILIYVVGGIPALPQLRSVLQLYISIYFSNAYTLGVSLSRMVKIHPDTIDCSVFLHLDCRILSTNSKTILIGVSRCHDASQIIFWLGSMMNLQFPLLARLCGTGIQPNEVKFL